jgi:CheY-like chemotaxis protein
VSRDIPAELPAVDVDPARLRHLLLVLTVAAIRGLGEPRTGSALTITADVRGEAATVLLAYRRAPASTSDQPVASPSTDVLDEVARSFGGSLRREETADGGTFELRLPIAAVSTIPEREAPAPTVHAADASASRTSPVVLVCDDEPSIRSLLVRVLRREGFGTLVASSGDEALALLRSSPVDVVLTDQHMEGMTGIELFERAAVDEPERRPPFVVMTGEPDADDLVRLAEHADVTVLPKPFETGVVAETIRELVDPEGYLG